MIIEEIKKIDSSPKKVREFGWVMTIFFGILAGLFFLRKGPSAMIYLYLSAGFLVLTLILPIALKPLQKAWMTIAVLMGWVMSRVILGILFYLAMTPIALILRMTGKDLLDLKIDPAKDSYWHLRSQKDIPTSDYERQF